MTEERILDFLDGNLGASEEEELLHRLAVSPERRNLLKQHLQMRELTAALARNSYITVPKVVTASLFTTLAANGYAGPSMPAAAESLEAIKFSANRIDRSAENIIASRSTGVFSRSSLVLASIVSFIVGAAVLYFVMPEARQEKFAALVSNIFQGQSSAMQPLKAEIASVPMPPSAGSTERNLSESHTNQNLIPANKHSLSGHGSEFDYSALSDINNINVGINPSAETTDANLPVISTIESKYPPAITMTEDIHGSNLTSKNPFDPIKPDPVSERSFLQRLAFSVRAGEGKAPGNEQALTGSLMEVKVSYDISDLFVAKISAGNFMPYETQAVTAAPQYNRDGFRLLELKPVLQYRAVLGAELGVKFDLFSAPFEITGGVISDMQGSIVPRFGFFTSLSLQDNLSMNLGMEAMIYSHDISSSLRNAQAAYAGEHPSLIGGLQSKESTGFIGPAIELVWHF